MRASFGSGARFYGGQFTAKQLLAAFVLALTGLQVHAAGNCVQYISRANCTVVNATATVYIWGQSGSFLGAIGTLGGNGTYNGAGGVWSSGTAGWDGTSVTMWLAYGDGSNAGNAVTGTCDNNNEDENLGNLSFNGNALNGGTNNFSTWCATIYLRNTGTNTRSYFIYGCTPQKLLTMYDQITGESLGAAIVILTGQQVVAVKVCNSTPCTLRVSFVDDAGVTQSATVPQDAIGWANNEGTVQDPRTVTVAGGAANGTPQVNGNPNNVGVGVGGTNAVFTNIVGGIVNTNGLDIGTFGNGTILIREAVGNLPGQQFGFATNEILRGEGTNFGSYSNAGWGRGTNAARSITNWLSDFQYLTNVSSVDPDTYLRLSVPAWSGTNFTFNINPASISQLSGILDIVKTLVSLALVAYALASAFSTYKDSLQHFLLIPQLAGNDISVLGTNMPAKVASVAIYIAVWVGMLLLMAGVWYLVWNWGVSAISAFLSTLNADSTFKRAVGLLRIVFPFDFCLGVVSALAFFRAFALGYFATAGTIVKGLFS